MTTNLNSLLSLPRYAAAAAICFVVALTATTATSSAAQSRNKTIGPSDDYDAANSGLKSVPAGLAPSDWSSIRAAYEAGRHRVVAVESGGHQARNPGQQWRARFDGRGFLVQPDGDAWQWGLELTAYGFPGHERALPPSAAAPQVDADGPRLVYAWDDGLSEWFVNDARGLEHGFTVKQRPATPIHSKPSTLNFQLAVRGNLRPVVEPDGHAVRFVDAQGASVVNYSGLKVWDADGKTLPSHFAVSGAGVRLLVDERGARYPLTIDPIAQQAYLKPGAVGTTQAGDQFGRSVAVSGDTVVVGANLEDSSTTGVNSAPDESAADAGAAYVFVRSSGTWSQQAYLKPAAVGTTQAGDQFGISVAVSGDTVVVGAFFEDSNATGVNGTPEDTGGVSFNAGAAYVFVRSSGTWSQQAYLKPAAVGITQGGDNFGRSVAVSGDVVVVGANAEDSSTTGVNSTPDEDAPGSGAAYVFVRTSGTWSQQAYLKPAASGTTQGNDNFGFSVAVSVDTVVVGANLEDSSTTGVNSTPDEGALTSGAAYVFVLASGTWSQQAYLKPAAVGTTQAGDQFGLSVAVSGDTVVVGAALEDSSTTGVNSTADEGAANAGAAYVFVRSSGTWNQQAYLKPAAVGDTQTGDQFGLSVAVSGDTVVVGAAAEDSGTTGVNSTPEDTGGVNFNAGAAYVFVRISGTWSQQAYLKPASVGTTQAGDQFGFSVAVSGDTVVVGANLEDSSTTGVNSTPDEGAAGSGAACVFTGLGPVVGPEIAVERPAGTSLTDGVSSVSFGSVAVTSSADRTFTVRNTGTADLTGLGITIDGTDASQFSVTANPTAPVSAPNGSTTFTVRFAPAIAGANSAALHIASNDSDENPFDISLTGTGVPSLIEDWRQQYFGTPDNSGNAADTANPDGDADINLVEFAFGTDPNVSQTNAVSVNGQVITPGGPATRVTNLQFGVDFSVLYGRRKDYVAAGLSYTVRFSADLNTWVNSSTTPTVIADDEVMQAVTVPYPLSIGGKKPRFFQIVVSGP